MGSKTNQNIGIKAFILSAILLTVISGAKPALAKSYSYDYINITLDFQSDGTVIVRQERAYNFEGSFSFAYLNLFKEGADDIDFMEIRDLDDDTVLQANIDEDSTHVKATWNYQAVDEVKRFLITYRIEGAVERYGDVADFYWKVIENEHERIDNLYSTVRLPAQSPGLFKVFVHGVGEGELTFSEDFSSAHVWTGAIGKDTFVEFRILTGPDVFPNAQQMQEEMYESILEEERAVFSQSPAHAFGMALGRIEVIAILLAIPTVVFLYFFFKYGREHKVDYDRDYEQEPPSDIPPMALANLMEGEESELDITIEARGILATLFDLAVRGYLKIEEKEEKRFLGLGKKTEQVFILTKKGKSGKGLLKFEKDIIKLIFNCGDGNKVTGSEIADYSRMHSHSIREEIKEIDRRARGWFEKKYFKITNDKSRKMRNVFMVFLIVYSIFMGILTIFNWFSFLAIIYSLMLLIPAAVMLPKRTPESALAIKRWNAFKNFMSDFSAMKDAPKEMLYLWDRYLVYAVVLGVAEKLLKNVSKLVVQKNVRMHPVVWYHGLTPFPRGVMTPKSFSVLSSNISKTVNSLSSSTSVGGGFSGAGGGGGGGGGGASGAG